MRRVLSILLAVLAALTAFGGCGRADPSSETGTALEIYCFQAGKADAFLLTTENSAVLIDCGEKGFGQTILDALAERGIDRVDALILTHFDRDHVGGAAKVLNNIPVGTVYQNNSPKDSDEAEKYRKAVENAGIEPVTVRETVSFTLDGVRYQIDPPRSAEYDEDQSNNSSLITSVFNGEDSLLFPGDAQTARIREFLSVTQDSFTFLKVPHHGREEPALKELLSAVRPQIAVITSSDEEPEDESTLAALAVCGAEVFLTRQGPVLVRSTGKGITAEYVS